MERFLGRYATFIYALLRIVTGFLFMWHGSQKLLGFPARKVPADAPPQPGLDAWGAIGGGIELIGGFLIMIGLFTSPIAFIASGMMAVAYWFWHFGNQMQWLPIQNGGELAALYCFVFLYIASRGSGVWSIESAFKGSRAGANGA